jgi:hypothetical protein
MDEAGRKQVRDPDQVRAEFDAWLTGAPVEDQRLSAEERESADLRQLLGISGRR